MHIANPIYDAVFKFLLEDNKVAKLFLSTIIGREVEELEFRPEELKVKTKKKRKSDHQEFVFYSVYRIDFAAKIKTEEGSQLVLIEIQKANHSSNIMRFRKYLGHQYSNPNNVYSVNEPDVKYGKKALPIISIYFLGEKLQHTDAPVIQVLRNYYDAATKKEIKVKEEFIESLSHDSYVIQIPCLKAKRRNNMELLLSVFDQDNLTNDNHILNIDEKTLPEKYKIVLHRLQVAIADIETQQNLQIEEEIFTDFKMLENKFMAQDKALEESKKTLKESKKALEEKDQIIAELKKRLNQKKL